VPIKVARKAYTSLTPVRAGYCVGIFAFLLAACCTSLQNATAEGDTRTITLHHVHTEEDLTITYKVNGVYDEEALKKIDYELRDWRRDETIHMDPKLIDLLWEVHRDLGSSEPIYVVCGYRSPQTNAMLRARSSGVAKFSQHMLGKATDFYIPGVPLEEIRAVGLYLQRGGVGFYPTSGSPFVHLDTGNVRHWPAIATDEMPRLMAEGQKIHAAGEATQLAANRKQPAVMAKLGAPSARPTSLDSLVAQIDKPAQPTKARPQAPTFEMASAESRAVELRPAQQASLVARAAPSANDIISQRDIYWRSMQDAGATAAPQTNAAPRPPAPIPTPTVVASADPDLVATQSISANLAPWPLPDRGELRGGTLAYASPSAPAAAQPPRAAPMGTSMNRPTAPPDTTVAVKRVGDRPSLIASPPAPSAPPATAASAAKSGDQFNEPWLRALILSPSAQDFMSTASFGQSDYRSLAPYMRKPSTSVMMTFSADPQLGMTSRKFSGTAVVFVSTMTYGMRTASLR
jgi:uncharacterized protein YcbK (DUF882 family)